MILPLVLDPWNGLFLKPLKTKANLSGEIQSGDTLEITEAQIEAELVQ